MKKQNALIKSFVVILCGIISLGMTSCSTSVPEQSESTSDTKATNPYQEKSDLEIADESTGIVFSGEFVNSDQIINLNIKNNTKKHLTYGNRYYIEYHYDGDWYKVPLLPNVYFPGMLYEAGPGRERSFKHAIKEDYGLLPSGHYRIIKDVRITDTMDDDTDMSTAVHYYVAVEFDILDQ